MATRRSYDGSCFGKLTVIADVAPLSRYARRVECRCQCGTVKHIGLRHLLSGKTISCGCHKNEGIRQRSTIHGHKPRTGCSREYDAWCNLRRRCYDPEHPRYADWGGRGISVCDRWRHDFAAFIADMGPRPPKHQIDRINNDGNYEPGNCRWANTHQQRHNRRLYRPVVVDGRETTIADLARRHGFIHSTLHRRLKRGWPLHVALTLPPDPTNRPRR